MSQNKDKGTEAPEGLTYDEESLITDALIAEADELNAEPTSQLDDEILDADKLRDCIAIVEKGPDAIKGMQRELAEASAYVGKFSKRNRQVPFNELVKGFQKSVTADLKQREDITKKVSAAVKHVVQPGRKAAK